MTDYLEKHQRKWAELTKPPIWVASAPALEELRADLERQTAIAVDTESDSLYSYFEKVCLLQYSTRSSDYVLDPLAVPVAPLGAIFEDRRVEKVFHAAEYDLLCLKRDNGFVFQNLFDTMVASRILGWKNIGLGSILQERFGIELNKKMQRADWGRRPLTDEQLAYAREDTHYLLALRDLQMAELEAMGRMEEAREEFERLTRVEPTPRRFDPEAYWNIPGARDLDAGGLGVLRELFVFRDAQARREDRPPFKVMSDSTLLRISVAAPRSAKELARLGGMSDHTLQRYGAPILRALERGRAAPQVVPPRPHARETPLDNAGRNRLGRLKEWRKDRAARRGVAPDVIVSNDVLFSAARKDPRTFEELLDVTGLGPWKAKTYGEDILTVLHGKRK